MGSQGQSSTAEKGKGVKKQPGCTWIELNNKVHTFVVDDQDHPQISEIHAELKRLSGWMHEEGYVPETKFVLHDVEEEEKVSQLCHHSEKLAIAFGHLLVLHRAFLRICGYVGTVTRPQSSLPRLWSEQS